MDQRLTVQFQVPYRYEVCFTTDVLHRDNRVLANVIGEREPHKRHRVLCVVDEGVERKWPGLARSLSAYATQHADRIELAAPPLVVPGGEAAKNTHLYVDQVLTRLAELRFDRQSFVVVIGGGAVQDMAGFAAATAHRGVRMIRLPTTVLSQNDAGIGVKNGINAFGFKNYIGSFAPPFAVINDFRFLTTLSERDRLAGIAEAIKVALIRDPDFFEWLCGHVSQLRSFDAPATETMIQRCAELHLAHIQTSGDPFEFGSARPLDFGHWAAHKLERLSEHSLRHGEAVAIGMALDVRYSVEAGLLPPHVATRVVELIRSLGLPTYHPELASETDSGALTVLAGLEEFQEHLGGELSVTLLSQVGETVECHNMDPALVARSVRWLIDHQMHTEPELAPGAAE